MKVKISWNEDSYETVSTKQKVNFGKKLPKIFRRFPSQTSSLLKPRGETLHSA